MDELLKRAALSIVDRNLFSQGQRILVAVSGGLDSMVLLHLLHQLAPTNGWRLVVAHLNHQLRGVSSIADERLVVRVAAQLGLRTVVERADVRAVSRQRKISLEMAARNVRHEFLARAARMRRIRTIALAHHGEDLVELFFLRLFRGTGGEGLAGLKWRNRSPADPAVELVRPLLAETKESLRRYAAARRVRFREDRTNANLDIQRNRVRHQLLPLIARHYQPAITDSVRRLSEIVGAESDFAAQAADEWLEEARQQADNAQGRLPAGLVSIPFDRLHLAVQRRCLLLQLLEMGLEADFELVERLRRFPGHAVNVAPRAATKPQAGTQVSPPEDPQPFSVVRTANGLLRRLESPSAVFPRCNYALEMEKRAGRVEFEGLRIRWRVGNTVPLLKHKSLENNELFDADKVGARFVLRHWRAGDRFQPIGMDNSVKLQDLFTNQKVPRNLRHTRVLATNAAGEIFWVEGLRISERFKLTPSTTRRLLWHWERL